MSVKVYTKANKLNRLRSIKLGMKIYFDLSWYKTTTPGFGVVFYYYFICYIKSYKKRMSFLIQNCDEVNFFICI